jgi:hypothetical protein
LGSFVVVQNGAFWTKLVVKVMQLSKPRLADVAVPCSQQLFFCKLGHWVAFDINPDTRSARIIWCCSRRPVLCRLCIHWCGRRPVLEHPGLLWRNQTNRHDPRQPMLFGHLHEPDKREVSPSKSPGRVANQSGLVDA